MILRLADRVALITGAAGGIGAAVARRLRSEGARVVVTDIDDSAGHRLTEELAGMTAGAMYHRLDVSVEVDWHSAVGAAVAAFGGLDILVNNAAFAAGMSIDDVSLEQWNSTIAVTQTGVFLGMKCAGPALLQSDHASVINISSILGSSGGVGLFPAYHSAKGAVRTLTKNVALAWAERNVRVNSIHPGFIDVVASRASASGSSAAQDERMIGLTPMRRLGRPDEVAAGVAYLASDDSSFVTGSELYIDGGFMAR